MPGTDLPDWGPTGAALYQEMVLVPGDVQAMPVQGLAAVGVQLHFTGTGGVVTFGGTINDAQTVAIYAYSLAPAGITLVPPLGGTTQDGLYLIPCTGFRTLFVFLDPGIGHGCQVSLFGLTSSPYLDRFGASLMAGSYPVVLATDQPPLSVMQPGGILPTDTQVAVGFNVQLAAGASLDLIPAIAGQTIYCESLNVSVDTAAAAIVNFEDDNGRVPAWVVTTVTGKMAHPLYGVALSNGHKARLRNVSAVLAGFVSGEVIAVQKA